MSKNLEEIKEQFVAEWAVLGQAWGINRTMAQIQALFLVSDAPLNTDQVMAALKISRGNAHANIKELITWQLVRKVVVKGDRKEYFVGERDPWKIFCKVAAERKRREIDPLVTALDDIGSKLASEDSDEATRLTKQLEELSKFAAMGSKVLDRIAQSEESRITKWFLQLSSR